MRLQEVTGLTVTRGTGPLRLATACALLFPLGGCVHSREKTVAVLHDGVFAPRDGEWDPATPRPPGDRPQTIAVSAPAPSPIGGDGWDAASPSGSIPREAPRPPASEAGPVVRSSSAPLAHRPLAGGRSLEQRAREVCLDCETLVEADKATLYVAPALAAEARLEGRVLTLRRLTIRAQTLKLVARTDGRGDVSISARGSVRFRSDRPASIIDEEGLKSLLVTNDGYTPLR